MTSRADTARSQPDRQHLGAQIRDARQRLGMTQRQFATIAGIRQCSVSYIENAARDVLASTLIDAAAAVGLEVVLVPVQLDADPNDCTDPTHPRTGRWCPTCHDDGTDRPVVAPFSLSAGHRAVTVNLPGEDAA